MLFEDHATTRPVRTFPLTSFSVAVSATVPPIPMFAVAGATVTVATGASVTVTDDVPVFPSLVAVMVAVPAATPVTTPLDDTVAIALLLDDQVTTRPVSTLPAKSFVVAVSVVVPATKMLAVDGDTVTVDTGINVTVTSDDPLFVSAVAVMVAVPGSRPLTTPVDDTVATSELLDDQVTGRSVTTLPFASFTCAVSVVVCVVKTLAVAGDTVTLPTGRLVTVTVELPDFPSLVAVMVAVPRLTAVTSPAEVTVAMFVLFELHVTTRSVTVVPF